MNDWESRLQICHRKTFSETIRHRWYQAGSKYWWNQGLAALIQGQIYNPGNRSMKIWVEASEKIYSTELSQLEVSQVMKGLPKREAFSWIKRVIVSGSILILQGLSLDGLCVCMLCFCHFCFLRRRFLLRLWWKGENALHWWCLLHAQKIPHFNRCWERNRLKRGALETSSVEGRLRSWILKLCERLNKHPKTHCIWDKEFCCYLSEFEKTIDYPEICSSCSFKCNFWPVLFCWPEVSFLTWFPVCPGFPRQTCILPPRGQRSLWESAEGENLRLDLVA